MDHFPVESINIRCNDSDEKLSNWAMEDWSQARHCFSRPCKQINNADLKKKICLCEAIQLSLNVFTLIFNTVQTKNLFKRYV